MILKIRLCWEMETDEEIPPEEFARLARTMERYIEFQEAALAEALKQPGVTIRFNEEEEGEK